MAEENDKGNGQKPLPVKKLPYVPPKLTELGTVEDITRAAGQRGSLDGSSNPNKNRTSV